MRHPASVLLRFAALAGAVVLTWSSAARATELAHADALWLDRITFGLDSASVARYESIGRKRFLDEQLSARDERLPSAVQAQIDALKIDSKSTTDLITKALAERKQAIQAGGEDAKQLARKESNKEGVEIASEAIRRELLRATYSPAQLKEQMVWFWLNHFNVFARKGYVKFLIGDYADRAIRPHALGKFRDLVMASLTHPAMIQYLDNAQNASDHINENYARELMELHTLGVDGGYSQADVQQLARVLTGVGINVRQLVAGRFPRLQPLALHDGLFAFNPSRHDFGDKVLLGEKIRGQGFDEVKRAVDILVRQPACARFISSEMATYFVSDTPDPALVDAMARTFRDTDGDIARVLRTMFESPQFTASLGKKFKDPMHFVVSSLRMKYDGEVLDNQRPILGWLAALGELPFARQTPDGYSLTQSGWASSGQMSRRFEIARAIAASNLRPPMALDAARNNDIALNPVYRQDIAPYLSGTTIAALDKATSPNERATLLLASPEFNYR